MIDAAPAPAQAEAPAQTESAPAEKPSSSVFEVLSSAERAYLESGGEKTDGLFSDNDSDGSTSDSARAPVTPDSAPIADPAAPDQEQAAVDAPEPGEVVVGEDGRVRDAKGKFVPLAALQQERTQRKTIAEQLQLERVARETATTENARMSERLSQLQAALDAAKAAPTLVTPPPGQEVEADPTDSDEPIDPDIDLFGAFKQLQKRIMRVQEKALGEAKKAQESSQYTQAQIAEQQLLKAYQDDAVHFARANPDFGDAYQHLSRARRAELELLGITDPTELQRRLFDEERQIAIHALRANKRPSELVYGLAKAKGYVRKEATVEAPAPVVAAPAAKDKSAAMESLAKVEKAQRNAGATLSGGGGGASEADVTVETLANMDEGQFAAFVTKHGIEKVNRVMGK